MARTSRSPAPQSDAAPARATLRKGARRRSEVPLDVVAGLNAGQLATVNLVEFLVLDLVALAHAVDPQLGAAAVATITPEMGATVRMRVIGELAQELWGAIAVQRLATHTSDTVRGWAAYALAARPKVTLAARLKTIRPLADDPHFGVREWAWLALRPRIGEDVEAALDLLSPWVNDSAVGIRRFAVEITRPRGVWCAHLNALKEFPEPALPLLDPLHAEEHKYVQDSVANWLNDASKSQPDWVRALCRQWLRRSDSPATRRICQRALRTVGAK